MGDRLDRGAEGGMAGSVTDRPIEIGTVRLQGRFSPIDTKIDVWNGTAWMPLRGVTSVRWTLDANDASNRLPVLELTLIDAIVGILTPAERAILDLLPKPQPQIGFGE